ncbi:MAG: RNA-binding cell elongation regulator Jag/EloR [Syntrophales bacterium]|jgi:spoIIIJ-associated protein
MNSVEIEGRTIDEAIENACNKFQVPREKLNIEILSEGISGFLGIGSKKARIKASLLNLDITLDEPICTVSNPITSRLSIEPPRETDSKPAASQSGLNGAAEKARVFLEGLLTRMDLASPVKAVETDDQIILNIQWDGGGLVIGKRGQNLDALQYLVNKAINHSSHDRKMIVIDTESYRKRREESLVALANKVGQKVKKTSKAVTISHLNAHDRRIVHMALQNDESIATKSRGEGEFRKIIILPAKK